jgi:hypothetical protein
MDNMANVQMAGKAHQPTKAYTQQAMDKLYVTPIVNVEPRFIEHLMMHRGKRIMVCTTVEKMEGILDDVAVDHLALMVHDKKHHVRFGQIVYFA